MNVSTLLCYFAAILATAVASTSDNDDKTVDEGIWRQIARADMIAVGKLDFSALKGSGKYVNILFQPQETLKGIISPEKLVKISFYDHEEQWEGNKRHLSRISNSTAIIFTRPAGNGKSRKLYFSGSLEESVVESSETLREAVVRKMELQEKILSDYKPDSTLPHFVEVRKLIASIKDEKSQAAAFLKLGDLGKEGVPAIIAQMDDFRDLPSAYIALENPPGSFEGIRHYGPEKVVDALAAILNHITYEDFGTIYGDTPSEGARRKCVDGWRIYAYHISHKGIADH